MKSIFLKTFFALLFFTPNLSWSKTTELICVCDYYKFTELNNNQKTKNFPRCNETIDLIINTSNETIIWNGVDYSYSDGGNYLSVYDYFFLNNGDRIANQFKIDRITGIVNHTFSSTSKGAEKFTMKMRDYSCELKKNVKKLF